MVANYVKSLDQLEAWLLKSDTLPDIAEFFMFSLRNRTFPPNPNAMPPLATNSVDRAIWEQTQIGWDNLLRGRISTRWRFIQAQHYQSEQSRRSPDRWAADIIYRLLQISHSLWTTRNNIVHERDQQGLLLQEGISLNDSITEEYSSGWESLLPEDQHLIKERTLDRILRMPPPDKYTWLGAIRLAKNLATRHYSTETSRQSASLLQWLTTNWCNAPNLAPPPNDPEDDDDSI